AGMTVPGSRKLYAVGRIVIWVANELVAQGLDPQKLGPKLMLDKQVTQVAIANPVHAPYGRAAVTLLEHFGLLKKTREAEWEEMTAGIPAFYSVAVLQRGKPRFDFVYGENIAQTAQLAMASTKVGILALSIAKSPTLEQKGKYWLAPLSSHLRLNQNYVVLKGQDRPAVRKFYDYIATPPARAVLRHYGFVLPGEKPDE
ncbi:solute-binding protein, partial [Helicobacter pylori]|nr:solute-binding protein [Helicobacter pylori]MWR36433.1 solute-binding protein [Helicobacter pylori]